jgi:hypothetical protein
MAQHNGFGLDSFPENNTKAGKMLSKKKCGVDCSIDS